MLNSCHFFKNFPIKKDDAKGDLRSSEKYGRKRMVLKKKSLNSQAPKRANPVLSSASPGHEGVAEKWFRGARFARSTEEIKKRFDKL
jgi:hypothetical protein